MQLTSRIFVYSLLCFVAFFLPNTEAIFKSKDSILKDANTTQAELKETIAKISSQGYGPLTETLVQIQNNISTVVGKLSKATDDHSITELEMLYLRLKNNIFYEKLAAEGHIRQVNNLQQKAAVLLDELHSDIAQLEAANRTQDAEELRIDVQQIELFKGIIAKEKTRKPLQYIELLLQAAEGKIQRKLLSLEAQMKREKERNAHRSTTVVAPTTKKTPTGTTKKAF